MDILYVNGMDVFGVGFGYCFINIRVLFFVIVDEDKG